MKTKRLSILIEAENNKVYQVALTEDDSHYVLSLLEQLHNGKIRVLEQELEGVRIT
jgi:hypothetical protein